MQSAESQTHPPAKYVALTDQLYDYITRHRSGFVDPLLRDLRAETESLGEAARMLISHEQGDFLTLITRLLDARCAIEIGTFTGYSSICLARGLTTSGRLFCFDINSEWTAIARRYWAAEGVADRIELQLGDAKEKLLTWEPPHPLDLVFIDADKPGYDAYYEILLPKMKPNGLFIFDNMVWGGRVIEQPLTDPDGLAIDRLNQKLAADSRVESVLLPVADGLHFARKR
jgi:caffeoyl-CoA O-methyltransferase